MSRNSSAAPPCLFRYLNSSPEVIHLVVMMCVECPLSLRNVEDLLAERRIDVCHEPVRFWSNRFGPMFAAEIRRKRVDCMRAYAHWRWHLGKVFLRIYQFLCLRVVRAPGIELPSERRAGAFPGR
jgi:putative transposase